MAHAQFSPEPTNAAAALALRAGPESAVTPPEPSDEHITLCEAIDRVLNKGVVLRGELTISVAQIDLIYLGLQVLLCSVATGKQRQLSADRANERATEGDSV